ncbi:unnamed protein product, partial [Gongylonema pulchrum]|uniref:CST complex subunit CTC1 n=1 Tax=Gongylonema pulchrum TaxID=637853 RepID=A0A183EG42_9BILA
KGSHSEASAGDIVCCFTGPPTTLVCAIRSFWQPLCYDLVDGPASILHQIPNVRTYTATVTDTWREYELEIIAGDPSRIFKGKDSVRDLVTALTSCDNGPRRNNHQNRSSARK